MSNLSLSILGPFKATVDGQPLERFRSNKVQALLIYLTVEAAFAVRLEEPRGPIHRRDALMTLLWPEMPLPSAQSNLRQTLFRLRKIIPEVTQIGAGDDGSGTQNVDVAPLLLADRQTVQLHPSIIYTLDVATFHNLIGQAEGHQHPTENGNICPSCQQQWQQAVELYRGDFLSDFYLPDSPEFETWAEMRREELRRLMLETLDKLTDSHFQTDAFDQAQAAARQQLEIDNLREPAHRQLMMALTQSGQRSAALAHYESCRKMLLDELGVEPSEETQRLVKTIRRGESETSPHSISVRQPPQMIQPVEPKEVVHLAERPTVREDAQRILLHKVKSFWIESVLEQELQDADLIALTKEVRPEALGSPWGAAIAKPTTPRWTLPDDMAVAELLNDTTQALLILGDPGSGKTLALLTLAQATIIQSETDPNVPLPVVFNLSSWSTQTASLAEWLVDELNEKYLIPKKLGQRWIDEDRLLLLLDGLDEVVSSRISDCIRSINQFRKEHGLAQIAVCARTEVYAALDEKLRVDYAICLLPLSTSQIETYLNARAIDSTIFHQTMARDPGLHEMMRSPLMLSIAVKAFLASDTMVFPQVNTDSNLRDHLFATYVDHMLRRRSYHEPESVQLIKQQLSWLAQNMVKHNQTIFLIERIQGSWLTTRTSRWLFGFFLFLLISLSFVTLYTFVLAEDDVHQTVGELLPPALFATTIAVLILHSLYFPRGERQVQQRRETGQNNVTIQSPNQILLCVGVGLTAGLITFAVFAFLFPLAGIPLHKSIGLVLSSAFGLGIAMGIQEYEQASGGAIRTAETMHWSWHRALMGFSFGPFFWLLIDVGYRLLGGEAVLLTGRWEEAFLPITITGILFGCLFGLSGKSISLKSTPGQGIWLSLRNAVRVGTTVTIVIWLTIGLLALIQDSMIASAPIQPESFMSMGGRIAISVGLIMALFFGGVLALSHGLLRLFIWLKEEIPLNITHFLDHAVQLNFLRRVGDGYIFMHKLLQDYFAKQTQ